MNVEVALFGGLVVTVDAEPVELGPEKQRLVMAALALGAPHVVSKDRLIEHLWGDDPPGSVESSLAAYISNLRKALRAAGVDGAAVIETVRPGYRLGGGVTVDVAELSTSFGDGTATELAPLLPELRHVDFVARAADQIDLEVADAAEQWLESRLSEGDWRTVLRDVGSLIEAHPFREPFRLLQATALYRAGRQADALAAITDTRELLLDELGLDPGPRLADLESRILRQDPTLLATEPDPSTDPVPDAPVRVAPTRPERPITFGREAELDTVDRVLERLASGHGAVLTIAGQAGIGKSHLVDELVYRAGERGVYTLRSAASEGEADPPLWTTVTVMDQMVRDAADPAQQALRNLSEGSVALRTRVASSGVSIRELTDAQARSQLFDAIATGCRDLMAAGPFMIVMEDLHWADEPTMLLIERLAPLVREGAALFVGTARLDELLARSDGRQLMRALQRSAEHVAVELDGLDGKASADLVAHAGGGSMAATEIRELLERTQGNPLFLSEVAKLAQRSGAAVTEVPIPENVTLAIEEHVDRLPSETVDVLTSASFAHRTITPEIDAIVLDMDPDDVEEHYEAARAAGLLAPDPTWPGGYRFTHALIRAALYDRVRPRRRARLHAALGAAILDEYGEGRDLQFLDGAARHLCLGARAGSAERGIELARRAAALADGSGAADLAWAHLDRALDALVFWPDAPPSLEVDLLVDRATQAEILGESERAITDFGRAFELAVELDDPELIAEAALAGREGAGTNRSKFWWNPGRAGVDRLTRAFERVGEEGSLLQRLRLLSAVGADGAPYLGETEALAWAERAETELAVAADGSVPEATVAELRLTGLLSSWSHRSPLELLAGFDDLVAMEQKRTTVIGETELAARLGALAAQLETGDLASLPGRMEIGEARSAELPDSPLRWYLTAFHAAWLQATDELETLEALLDAAVDLTAGAGAEARENLVMARAATGLLGEQIEPHAQVVLDRAERFRRPNLVAPVAFALALARRHREARELIDAQSWHELSRPEPPPATDIGRIFSLGTVALLGRVEQVAELYPLLKRATGRLVVSGPGKSFQGPADYYLALAAVALGDDEAAEQHVNVGRAWCEAVGNQRFLGRFDDIVAGGTPFV